MTDQKNNAAAVEGLICENVRLSAELEQAYAKIGTLELQNEFLRRAATGEQGSTNKLDFDRQRQVALKNGRNGVFAS